MPVTAREFKRARQLTRHSAADVAKALGVSPSTVSRWESGEIEPSQDVVEWLQINRNQYLSDVRPLSPMGHPRGEHLRAGREAFVYPQTSVVANAAEKAA
jgi:transcriptional regulator with XRE-family HTH domain